MKKIMFDDKYGLTQAVVDERKTQTRRVIPERLFQECRTNALIEIGGNYDLWVSTCLELLVKKSPYKVGEVVAVAQAYKDISCDFYYHRGLAGWHNKMFVRADEMPHRIKITNIRVERLQDISEEDCLKEGVMRIGNYKFGAYGIWSKSSKIGNAYLATDTARQSFAALIDKISGQGTWASNPWVVVYDFVLVK